MATNKYDLLGKYLVVSSLISLTSYEKTCDRISAWAHPNQSCYIIAANVHVVMTAFWQPTYRKIVNQASIVTPDGMPLVQALKLLGYKQATRVYGPDLMLHCCHKASDENLSIFLYGSTEDVLDKLQTKLRSQFPNLKIAGVLSPPFRSLTSDEEEQHIDLIHQSGAQIVFVSLGCPRQEEWMARQYQKLNAVMIGVGAAFLFHSDTVKQAPRWMMAMGLEWLFRLWTEPKRLWKRYIINNPAFLVLFGIQLLKHYFRPSSG